MNIRIFHICLGVVILISAKARGQETSIDIFGGTAYSVFKKNIPVPDQFKIKPRFNPHFGAFLNINFDSVIVLRPGASYLNKAYFFVHELSESDRDLKAMVNQKIESFNFSFDLLYNKPLKYFNLKPFVGASYSMNRNNGGDVLYPIAAERYFVNPPPIVNVNTKVMHRAFGWRAGIGLQPVSFPAFEIEFLYGGDFGLYPVNSYEALMNTPDGVVNSKVNWQGRISYFSIILLVHLNKLV